MVESEDIPVRNFKLSNLFLAALAMVSLTLGLAFASTSIFDRERSEKTTQDFGSSENYQEYDTRNYPKSMDQVVDPPAGIKPSDVYTFSCELVLQKPTAFSTTCADFGTAIFEVKWSMWSAEGAKGTGVYSVNDCDPSCAEGTRHEVPVYLWLLDSTTDGKNFFLNTLRIVPRDVFEGKVDEFRSNYVNLSGAVVVEGKKFSGAEWDVSSDWKNFPELRSNLPK